MTSYFEFQERQTQGSVALDVLDWPGIVVTEAEPDEDTLLQMSLMMGSQILEEAK